MCHGRNIVSVNVAPKNTQKFLSENSKTFLVRISRFTFSPFTTQFCLTSFMRGCWKVASDRVRISFRGPLFHLFVRFYLNLNFLSINFYTSKILRLSNMLVLNAKIAHKFQILSNLLHFK